MLNESSHEVFMYLFKFNFANEFMELLNPYESQEFCPLNVIWQKIEKPAKLNELQESLCPEF